MHGLILFLAVGIFIAGVIKLAIYIRNRKVEGVLQDVNEHPVKAGLIAALLAGCASVIFKRD